MIHQNNYLQKLKDFQKRINYNFANSNLLLNAFVHKSYVNEEKKSNQLSNERLEFLGDSVLSLTVSDFLYRNFPHLNEGVYTDIKAALVNSELLAKVARVLDIGSLIILSKGERHHGGKDNTSILADTLEAVIGSIYLDSSYASAQSFIYKFIIKPYIKSIILDKSYIPSKSKLQELLQNQYKVLPVYKEMKSYGPEHKKKFIIGVYLRDKLLATGVGKSKKDAEEQAAHLSLQKLSKHI